MTLTGDYAAGDSDADKMRVNERYRLISSVDELRPGGQRARCESMGPQRIVPQ
jgi:hypothetical protein